jgi:hypothetical protein
MTGFAREFYRVYYRKENGRRKREKMNIFYTNNENRGEGIEQVKINIHIYTTGVLIASDTNARSALCIERVNNERGRILEEFLTTKQLYFLNEEISDTTFSNSKGNSNINLTIINP